jgi:serine/threonine protein kinase
MHVERFKKGAVIRDKYEVLGTLGQGGMGVVYAARHREHGELVALKFLHTSLSRTIPRARSRS